MPPKTPRVKGNVKAASSSRAAELSSASTTGSSLSMSSLGGFAQFATPAFSASSNYVASTTPRSATPSRSGSSSPAFGGHDVDVNVISNGELSMIIKRLMSKRDTITKVRALEDLEKWVKSQPEDEESGSDACQEAIGPWIKLYIKLTTDVDRRVRLLTNSVHTLLVRRVKRKLAPYLKEVIGAWIGTFFDPSKDVARLAMEAFKSAFPDNKREQVISFCLQDMIYYITEILLKKTPETFSDPRFNTKEEMEARYSRVASSSLYTIGFIIENLTPESLEKGSDDIKQLLDEPKLWQLFSNINPLTRRASYSLLRTITVKSPNFIKERLEIVSKNFFPAAFSDKDITTHADLWDTLLVFTKTFPESWLLPGEKKPTMALFFGFLKSAGYGSVTVTYRSIFPLIASWVDESVLGKSGTGFPFVKDFFEYFWKGLESPNIEKEAGGTGLFLEAYIECIVYLIVRFGKSEATAPGQDGAFAIFNKLVTTYLNLSDNSKATSKLVQDEQDFAKKISHHLVRLLTIPSVSERAVSNVWTPTSDAMIQLVSSDLTNDYVQRGKRVVMILSGVSAIAREKEDASISDLVEKTADQLVQVVAKQCTGTQSIGPSQLLSSLAVHFEVTVFTNPESQKAMHDFFNFQFADMLLTSEDQESTNGTKQAAEDLPHLLDLFAGYIGNSKEQQGVSQIWKSVMDKVLKETEVEKDLERQQVILQGLLHRLSSTQTTIDMNLDSIDEFVTNVVVDQRYKGSKSGEQLISTVLNIKNTLNSKKKLDILDTLSQRLELFVSDVMGGHGTGKSREASSILSITLETLEHIVPLSIENGAEGPLKQIIIAVFDLSHQSEENLGDISQKNLDVLQKLSEESEDVSYLLKDCLTEHIQDNIQNLQRFSSPEDLANQVLKLSDLLGLTDLSDRFELLSAFFFDHNHWSSLGKNLSNRGPHPSLAIIDPVVEAYFAEKPSRVQATKEPASEIRYDSIGLSAYGRLALFTFELLKKEDATVPLFLTYPEKMTWILGELLKVRQGCIDSLQTPSSDIGIFYSPNLHADANAVVFRTLLRELGSIFGAWFTLVLDEKWELQVINALANGPQSTLTNSDDDDDDSACSAAQFALMAIKEQDGFSERILTDVVRVLATSDSSAVSSENAKKWCQLIKSESLPLAVSVGLVTALRARLENSNEFTNLLNQWITTPVKPSEVSVQHLETTRRFTLLVAALGSPNEDNSTKLPQIRAMNLLQSARKWISESEALKGFEDQGELIMHTLVLRLLNSLAYQVQELPGAHWEMMLGYISSVFSGLGESKISPFAMLALERACGLTVSLIELGEEEGDILSSWDEHSESILISSIRLIGRDDPESNMALLNMDRPVRQYLKALSLVCSHAPDHIVLSHGSVSEHCRLLMNSLTSSQLLAFKHLKTILIEQAQTLSIQMEVKAPMSPNVDAEEDGDKDISANEDKMTEAKFPASLWSIISNPHRGFPALDVDVDADDDDFNFREEFSLLSSTNKDPEEEEDDYGIGAGVATKSEKIASHAVLGYLLAWKLAFIIFENTTYTVKSILVEQLRTSSAMNDLLPYLFHLLGVHSASSLLNDSSSSDNQNASSTSTEYKPTEPFDLSRWDITDYQVTGFDMSSPELGFPLLAGHLYYTCLANVPSLVRIWWTECKLRQLSIAVESLTERYFSPLLITRELNSLAKAQQATAAGGQAAAAAALSGVADDLNELQIKISKATSEINASFKIDDAVMEIVVRLPNNFPLRQVEVEGLQRVGVKEARWRAWLLAVAGVIAAQNGSLIDALTLFRKNVGLHFEGVEDCTICYSIVSLQDRSLPNKTCKTCKHRFHASCLYKWFRTSNSSSCPLCRTLW
ncbi:hypothetical protein BGZ76_004789 [Entomortierella beljakovae]|nr:hypothetical protein BGZ76_004789 [Entomortierella beljakovae]